MRSGISLGLLITCCATAVWAREEVTRDFMKTAALGGGKSLRIEHSLGNVVIHTQAKGEVQIRAAIKCSADRAEDARNWCDQIRIFVDESSPGVFVRTEYPRSDFSGGWHNFGYSVNYDITMPENAPLEVRNRFGAVSVEELHAPASILNSNGRVLLTGGRGRQRVENSFGDVEVARNDGDVSIVNTNGRVTASDITGALDLRDRFGEVRATNVGKQVQINAANCRVAVNNAGGPATITNSFGAVTVSDVRADVNVQNQNGRVEATGVTGVADLRTTFESVRAARIGKNLAIHAQNSSITGDTIGGPAVVDTSFGSIELRGVKGGVRATAGNSAIRLVNIDGEVYAKTSFNGVTVGDSPGPITVDNSNGSITVLARSVKTCQPITLGTTFGPIRVTVPQGVGYDVTAHTTFGHINSQPPMTMTGQLSGDALNAKIAGGGCPLKLSDQSGSIEILN